MAPSLESYPEEKDAAIIRRKLERGLEDDKKASRVAGQSDGAAKTE